MLAGRVDHPLMRGQGIGACLMAHALWAVQRSTSDLAILEAYPEKTIFETECPPRNVRAVSKLRIVTLLTKKGSPTFIGEPFYFVHSIWSLFCELSPRLQARS
jgi:hypothetical protein